VVPHYAEGVGGAGFEHTRVHAQLVHASLVRGTVRVCGALRQRRLGDRWHSSAEFIRVANKAGDTSALMFVVSA